MNLYDQFKNTCYIISKEVIVKLLDSTYISISINIYNNLQNAYNINDISTIYVMIRVTEKHTTFRV